MIFLEYLVQMLQFLFYGIGLTILFTSGVTACVQYFLHQPWLNSKSTIKNIEHSRVGLGQKIVFALEFFVIADSVMTVMGPSVEELYRIGLIVAIRTALSFFISREVYLIHDRKED